MNMKENGVMDEHISTEVIYKLHEFYRNKSGNYVVVAKEEGNSRGIFKLPATKLVSTRKDLPAVPADLKNPDKQRGLGAR
jgi:hypothetical protein